LPRIGRIELTELHEHHLDRLFGSMLGEGAKKLARQLCAGDLGQ
jgi:hypothetical protein